MTGKRCARLWQVEAVRDGRLAGSDLSNALRHRAECADCGEAARALSELGRQIKGLPSSATDPLLLRRTRQALLGTWNEQLLRGREPKTRRRGALIAASCTAGALALAAFYPLAHRARSPERATPFFEVVVKPGTRWAARETPHVTRITLQDGVASFTVHRPSGQRMIVQLPDGEIEDLGTVFEVEVQKQRTVQVSVSQGRVLVRLNAQPAFELSSGQSWQAQPSALPSAPPAPLAATASVGAHEAPPAPAKPSRISPSTSARMAPPQAQPSTQPPADTAEDDAYLQIVDLLRNGHEAEARANAARYLEQFPNGFRRMEVANIARR